MLSWEFPPLLAGGMGMACYGMSRALLQMGVEIDLILPTEEEVYFPLRVPEDVDILPVKSLDGKILVEGLSVEEKMKKLGLLSLPGTYASSNSVSDNLTRLGGDESLPSNTARIYIEQGDDLFAKVASFTGKMFSVAEHIKFDLIHAHDWLTYPAGVLLRDLTGKPLIAHIHATEFDRAGGSGNTWIHSIEYEGLQNADVVIAVSNYTRRMVIDRYRVNPDKVFVVHNAHSMNVVGKRSANTRIFIDPVVLFMGRVTLQKGPDYFIEVADRVLKRRNRVHFIVAGTGDMLGKIIHLSADKKTGTGILFTGFLSRGEVERTLEISDIFIMPSISEPFGIAPLEAMAFGVIPIISRESGVAEIVENAYKVDFWDVEKMVSIILNLIDSPALMREMSEKVAEEARRIQWEKAAEKILQIYKGVI